MFDYILIFSENFIFGKDFKEIVYGLLSIEFWIFYVLDFKDFLIKKLIKFFEKESVLVEGILEVKRLFIFLWDNNLFGV